MQCAHGGSACDRQAKPIREERHDLAERQTQVLVQQRRRRDGLRTELHGGGAHGVGCLERMPPLHPTAALPTAADVDIEATHQWADGRQIFLILRGHVRAIDGGATIGTRRRHRHVECVVNHQWNGPPAVATIGGTGLPARTTRMDRRGPFRERGRLPEARATRCVQLLPDSLVLPPRPIPFPLEPRPVGFRAIALLTHAGQFVFQLVDDLARTTRRRIAHAPVMPEFPRQYKSDPVTNNLFPYNTLAISE